MTVKYYKGFEVEDGEELPAEKARQERHYAKATFGASSKLEKVELYSGGKLLSVDYYGAGSQDEIRAAHLKLHKGVEYTRRRAPVQAGSFSWELVESHAASGELEGFTAILQDKHRRGWMEVHKDVGGHVTEVMKYFWASPEVLKYVFEYDEDGKLISVHDVVHRENTTFQDVKSELPDRQFFEAGLNLPKELAGTGIPQ
jgi:hypothetical protein